MTYDVERVRDRIPALRDGTAYFDGPGGTQMPDVVADAMADLRRRAEAAGREPKSISVTVFAFDGADGDTILRYHDLGIDRLVLVAPRARDDALAFVDRFAEMNVRVA